MLCHSEKIQKEKSDTKGLQSSKPTIIYQKRVIKKYLF
jgi:hypothetical protein